VVHTAEAGLLQRPCFIGFLSLLRQLAEREGFPTDSRWRSKKPSKIRLPRKQRRRFVTTSVYHLFVDDKDSKFRFVGADRGVTRGIGSIDASPAKARWFEGLRRDYRRAISYPSPLRRVLRSLPVTPVLLSIETTYSTNSSLGARQGFFFLVAFGFNLSAVAGPALIEPLKLSESEQG
jgi:hypothetical protein